MIEPVPDAARAAPAVEIEAWSQQPGENDLWYSRFLRFIALGPSRSVSLLAMGRRNAYPVPAHWPIQAKQWNWRERAKAFDEAAKVDPRLIEQFNNRLEAVAAEATNGEAGPLSKAVASGGYHAIQEDDQPEIETT